MCLSIAKRQKATTFQKYKMPRKAQSEPTVFLQKKKAPIRGKRTRGRQVDIENRISE